MASTFCAHRSALDTNLSTAAVLAHGFDRIYPYSHANTAKKMQENGGLLTDFPSGSEFHPGNFLSRNRIIAGISEATVVIESSRSGGAMFTAKLANSYNREVFVFPGRVHDSSFKGCNHLIKTNQAILIESAEELAAHLQWD